MSLLSAVMGPDRSRRRQADIDWRTHSSSPTGERAATDPSTRYEVPTFDELLDLVGRESRRRGAAIGVYPETKHATYFDSIGLSLEQPLVAALERHHPNRPNARVFVQSFETGNLRSLRNMLRVPLVQLVGASGAPHDPNAKGDAVEEYLAFLDAGVDGVFSDHTDTAVAARDVWLGPGSRPPRRDSRRGPPRERCSRGGPGSGLRHSSGMMIQATM